MIKFGRLNVFVGPVSAGNIARPANENLNAEIRYDAAVGTVIDLALGPFATDADEEIDGGPTVHVKAGISIEFFDLYRRLGPSLSRIIGDLRGGTRDASE